MNQNATTSVPRITSLLLSKGKNTVGHETNLARSPLWNLRKRVAHVETVVSPVLYGRPFRHVAGSQLTTADQQLFAHLTTMFVRGGCPDDRRVPFSLGDAAIALGYEDLGGKQRNLVRQSLARLGSVMLESAVRHPDGHETVLGWGLIDSYLISTRGGGKGWVTVSEAVSLLLREGSVTFLHAPTWSAITHEDEVAGRLWSFLESENIGGGWRYSLFPSEDGALRAVPTISEVVMLQWASRGEVAKRVRRACQVIESHDRRYRVEVRRGRAQESWLLHCSRTSQPVRRASGPSVPAHLLSAWREVYKSHLPSDRQKAVLLELLDRHTSEWIISTLRDGHRQGSDPMRQVLDRDAAVSEQRVRVASEDEGRWEGDKRRENAGAERSLAELLLAVDGIRTPRHSEKVVDPGLGSLKR
jgi:hypothetical protein